MTINRRMFVNLVLSASIYVVPVAWTASATAQSLPQDVQAIAAQWVIDAATAKKLIAEGATVLDARGADLKKESPVSGATEVVWQDFTGPEQPTKGRLLSDDAALTAKLQGFGVSASKPVVVVADSKKGWGEDGRIVWTLRTLGHSAAFFVDGGVVALAEGGLPQIAIAGKGDFVVKRVADYEITKEELKASIGKPNLVILDTREPREYAGETPYGEARGGHVPGAKHIFYKDLLDDKGDVLKGDALKAKLAKLGVSDGSEVVSYCTGGIRSGFVTAVLNNAGLKARNYAGSMWEWSAQPAEEFPLVTSTN